MTIQEAKNKLVSWCNSQVGTHEGANNYNKYAADPRITQLLGWNAQNQPWCDIFTDEAFIDCFGLQIGAAMTYQSIGRGSALCSASAQFFKNNGAWSGTPEVGDVVFFYVSGGINHQGIVTGISGNTITTVEGNSSDMVARRTYTIGSSQIAGYGRPKWSLVTQQSTTSQVEKPNNSGDNQSNQGNQSTTSQENHAWKPATLSMSNAYKADCVVLQALLNAHHFPCGSADGFYGAKTQAAVNAAQKYFKLTVDGICGPMTWQKLGLDKTIFK